MATFEFKMCLKAREISLGRWGLDRGGGGSLLPVLCMFWFMNSVLISWAPSLCRIVLRRQWWRRQVVLALLKACGFMGSAVEGDKGRGRHKGLTRIYNPVCDYVCAYPLLAMLWGRGGNIKHFESVPGICTRKWAFRKFKQVGFSV